MEALIAANAWVKAFALILTINGQVYEVDSGLTGEDCIARIEQGVSTFTDESGNTVSAKGGFLACEQEWRN